MSVEPRASSAGVHLVLRPARLAPGSRNHLAHRGFRARRAAEAAPRPHRAVHQDGAARAVAADLRPDVLTARRHRHRRRAVSGVPRAGHHRAVGAVHLDLLRHPDRLGPRRRHPGQADGDARAGVGAGHRQGVRRRGAFGRAGDRRGGAGIHPGRADDRQPAADPRRDGRRRARIDVLRLPVDDAGGPGPQPGPVDGHRPGHHDAVVLRVQRALPGRRDAAVAALAVGGQPAVLRGQRAARTADRQSGQPAGSTSPCSLVAAVAGIAVASMLLRRLVR